MNRGFGFYFGNAMKTSAATIWKRGNIIRFFAYFFMEMLARITLIFSAVFDLSNVRQAKFAQKKREIDVPQSFKIACRRESLRTMIMCIIVEALIFAAGILLILTASALLGLIGYVISLFVSTVSAGLLVGIFFAPGALVMLIYFIIMPLMFVPTAYIIETNPDIGVADTLSICFNTMKSKGKFTYFLNAFIPALVEGAIISIGVVASLLVSWFVFDYRLRTLLIIVIAIVIFVAFALVAPMFCLARRISNKSLFEDIVLDPVNASKRTNGVNIKKCKGVKFDPSAIENELVLLFDETYDDRVPLPESPSAQRRRLKEEAKRAKEARAAQINSVPAQPVWTAQPAVTLPEEQKPANTEEDEGELLTVSGLIGDVENASATAEAPEQASAPAQPEEEAPTEEIAQQEPFKQTEEVAEEPVKQLVEEQPSVGDPEEEPAEEKVEEPEEAPAEKPAATETAKTTASRTAAKKSTASKATVSKTATAKTAAKTTVAKSASSKTSASKTTATKTTAAKTAAKTTTAKSAATKSTASKSTTAKSTASKTSTAKSTSSKTAASKTTTAKKTTSTKASKPAGK